MIKPVEFLGRATSSHVSIVENGLECFQTFYSAGEKLWSQLSSIYEMHASVHAIIVSRNYDQVTEDHDLKEYIHSFSNSSLRIFSAGVSRAIGSTRCSKFQFYFQIQFHKNAIYILSSAMKLSVSLNYATGFVRYAHNFRTAQREIISQKVNNQVIYRTPLSGEYSSKQVSKVVALPKSCLHHILQPRQQIQSMSQEQSPEVKPDVKSDTHINLKVSDGSSEIFFKIKRSTPLKRLMDAFAKRQGKDVSTLRFLVDGTRVNADNTPDDLDLEDGDVIEAHRQQVGGYI